MRIDAHHHLWQYESSEFAWIEEPASALRRDFLPEEFEAALRSADIDASVVVQARQSMDETYWLLECARQSQRICGVVGWVPLEDINLLPESLHRLKQHCAFVGTREILQDKPSGFLMRTALHQGIHQLTAHDLAFDLLLRADQLDESIHFVDQHPNQRFVLDHCAKPRIADHEMEPWASSLRHLAERPNVFCKLSGLVTEANWKQWTEADLLPYLDTCLEAFGPERCMAGSDWPVCLVAVQYGAWWNLLERWMQKLSLSEQQKIMGETSAMFYRLPALRNQSQL